MTPPPEEDKHTPGPWIVTGCYGHMVGSGRSETDHRDIICELWRRTHNQGDLAANAQLIARAPSLLEENRKLKEALKSVIDLADDHNSKGEERENE